MKKLYWIFSIFIILSPPGASAAGFLQHPQYGKIDENTTYGDLKKFNLPIKTIIIKHYSPEEGVIGCEIGSIMAPGIDSEIQIEWKTKGYESQKNWVSCQTKPTTDFADKTKISQITVKRYGSLWATRYNVKVGTTLTELEKITGHKINFYGFEWDYGGTILDEIKELEGVGQLTGTGLGENDKERAVAEKEFDNYNLIGDQKVTSASLPLGIKNKIFVPEIILSF